MAVFAAHYGVVILPTRPCTPRHKGQVERGIDYVQESALAGLKFASLREQNDHASVGSHRRLHAVSRHRVVMVGEVDSPHCG